MHKYTYSHPTSMYAYTPRACIHAVTSPYLAYYFVMSHISINYVPHVNESFPTCEWVMSCRHRSWLSCPTYECVMSHTWMSHILHFMEWVMFHIPHMRPSPRVMPAGHDAFTCGTWLIHTWDMTHSGVQNDSFMRETWLIYLAGINNGQASPLVVRSIWEASCPQTYMGQDSFIFGTWLIHVWDMTHSFSKHHQWWYGAFVRLHVPHTHMNVVMSHIWMSRVPSLWISHVLQASSMVSRSISEAPYPPHTYVCCHVPSMDESCPRYVMKSSPAGIKSEASYPTNIYD